MTTEEIIKGNRTIAKYMNLVRVAIPLQQFAGTPTEHYPLSLIQWTDREGNIIYDGDDTMSLTNQMKDDTIPYHLSWDWIMPVVEKIALTRGVELRMSIGSLEIASTLDGWHGSAFCLPGKTGLECWWMSVVEFLEWYSKKKDGKKD